jgi:hypothetical protein
LRTVTVLPAVSVLNPTVSGALSISGNVSLGTPGVIAVDSGSAAAIQAGGKAQVSAAAIQEVGGYSLAGNAALSPAPATGIASFADPLAGLPVPTVSNNQGAVNLSGNQSLTINPGIYTSIKVSGNARLIMNPGVYVLAGGGMTVTGNASVSGSGVLIYNAGSNYSTTGSGGNFGGITLSSTGSVSLSAPGSGPYAGVVIFQSRDNNRAMSLSGTAAAGLTGAVYAPAALLTIGGGAQLPQTPLVVNRLQVSGGGSSTLTDGTDSTNSNAGELLAGDLSIYVDNSSGYFTTDELNAIQDAINNTNNLLAPYNVTVSEVSDPTVANLTIDSNSTSACGGLAQGVLGCFNADTAEVTLIQGWDWYAGSDPTAIGASQYSFETTVTHELGHALGLGGSSDPNSPMYETLPAGAVKGGLTAADLNVGDLEGSADPLRAAPAVGVSGGSFAAGSTAGTPAGAGVQEPPAAPAGSRGVAAAALFAPPAGTAAADAAPARGAAFQDPGPAPGAPAARLAPVGVPDGAGAAVGAPAGFGALPARAATPPGGAMEHLPTGEGDAAHVTLPGHLLPGAGTTAVDALMAQLGRGSARGSAGLALPAPPAGTADLVQAEVVPDRPFLAEGRGGALALCSLLALQGAAEAQRKRRTPDTEAGRPAPFRRDSRA